jgi:hypothetical protein
MKLQNLLNLSDEALIKAHLQTAESDAAKGTLNSTEAGRVMIEADADRRASLAARGIELWIKEASCDAGKVSSALLRADQKAWTAARLAGVVEAAAALSRDHEHFLGFQRFPHKPLISAVEKAAARESLPAALRAALERWKAALMPRALTPREERELGEAERDALKDVETTPWSVISKGFATMERLQRIRTPLTEESRLIARLSRLLSAPGLPQGKNAEPFVRIDTTDAIGIKIAADVASGGRAAGHAWAELLQHARTLTATAPSAKWLEVAAQRVAAIDALRLSACVSDWFNEAGKAAPQKLVSYREVADATLLNECSVELLKGLAWTAVAAGRADLAPALGNLAEACFKKVPNIGPRNVKLGNAAVAALAALAEPEAAAQLSRLRLRVKHPSSRATIDKALATMSRKTGMSPDDLAEMSVPAFGFDANGRRRVQFGDCACEMRVVNAQAVELLWTTGDGKKGASAPAIVRKQHGEDLKRWQREARDASAMIAAQALRLERSYLSDRNWTFDTWRERFLDHPLAGTLARRLIWQFDETPAFPWQGRLLNADDRPVQPKGKAIVSLWHPIGSPPEHIMAWRAWLERHELTQPFKQAHREIYVLTEAERRTRSYSNRFAGHILRQHQFAALCQQRGWDYRVMGDFDSHNTPTLNLPAHGLTAELGVEAVENEISPRGIFLYAATDQVRFGRPLDEVPPVVFSEVMRDADLFVGVASVANDPTWRDNSPAGRCRTYWEHWSFGELSENAKTRKEVLQRLLPRLKIAGKCAFEEKFLVVRGQLRTYKIHLGSGNILMAPNDQYLCIAPDRSSAGSRLLPEVFLPFEGDNTLAVILSKAFLLSEDTKIKDETITRQIQSG